MHCGFMDSRLRRFPPDRASAVSYGQTVGNATRCPPLAHRSAAAHKLHSAQSNRYKIRESQNQIPGTGLSLFLPGDCPNDRDHRIPNKKKPPAKTPTVREVVRLTAQLGGFLARKGDGEPGVKSLWLGIVRLRDYALTVEHFRTQTEIS